MWEIVDELELETDYPKCSITHKDTDEQTFILNLCQNPYLPNCMQWETMEEYD